MWWWHATYLKGLLKVADKTDVHRYGNPILLDDAKQNELHRLRVLYNFIKYLCIMHANKCPW